MQSLFSKQTSLFFLSIILLSYSLLSQNNNSNEKFTDSIIIKKNGKEFIKHYIKPKQTLYSIKKYFNIPISIIKKENPKISNHLSIGQVLFIPVQKYETNTQNLNSKYIPYKVQTGNTVYSICKEYNISKKELYYANPQIILDGLKNESYINIPIKEIKATDTVKKIILEKKTNTLFYEIKPKDNFYRLSKKFHTTIKQIKKANPNITSLKPGQRLLIPKEIISSKKKLNELLLPKIIEEKDTSNLSKNNLKLPIDKLSILYDSINQKVLDTSEIEVSEKIKSLTLVLLLPLNRKKYFNDSVNSLENLTLSETVDLSTTSKLSIELLQGVETAIREFELKNFKIILKVFDTEFDNSPILDSIIQSGKLDSSNFIIGPLFKNNLIKVLEYSKKKSKRIITPVKIKNSLLANSPYFFKANTSSYSMKNLLAAFIYKKYAKQNLLFLHTKEDDETSYPFLVFLKQKFTSPNSSTLKIKEIFYSQEHPYDSLFLSLTPNNKNIIICNSKDEIFTNRLLRDLSNYCENEKFPVDSIQIIGHKSWLNFSTLNISYLNQFKFTTQVSRFTNYKNPKVQNFIRNYFKDNNSYPSEYAILGYDLLNFSILSHLYFNSENYLRNTNNNFIPKVNSLSMNFNFKRFNPHHGYENIESKIIILDQFKLKHINQ